ncbi:Dynactin subunit 4 [Sesbania bispinosa]|nr:Dynactin subunit 4 [Sesbania bispinosa]
MSKHPPFGDCVTWRGTTTWLSWVGSFGRGLEERRSSRSWRAFGFAGKFPRRRRSRRREKWRRAQGAWCGKGEIGIFQWL